MAGTLSKVDLIWYSPWFGDLTSNYLDELSQAGISCLLITSDAHLDNSEIKFSPNHKIKLHGTLFEKLKAYVQLRRYFSTLKPEVFLFDMQSRFIPLLFLLTVSRRVKCAVAIHEIRPVDKKHRPNRLVTLLQRILVYKSGRILTFSPLSEELARCAYPEADVFTTPLLPPSRQFRDFVCTEKRQNFAMIGHYSEYKGLEFALSVWQKYVKLEESEEVLELWLSDAEELQIEIPNVRIRSLKSYIARQMEADLPTYKAILLPYKIASQSGVQILAQSAGVACVVSDVLGLVQNQPPFLPRLAMDDEDAWVKAISKISKSETKGELGTLSRDTLFEKITNPLIVRGFMELLGRC